LITDFSGWVGITDILGTAAGGPNDPTGLTYDADMRFMSGRFVGTDGHVHVGTFGFIWIDVFVGVPDFNTFSNQVHDFNPGIHPFPDGLFWIVALPPQDVQVQLNQGTASYRANDLALRDFGSIPNSLSNGSSVPASVTFDVEWSGITQRGTVRNAADKFALDFVMTGATIKWSASTASSTLHSTGVTAVNFAELARETNGVFFGSKD